MGLLLALAAWLAACSGSERPSHVLPRRGDPAPALDLTWLGEEAQLPSLRWEDLRGTVVMLDFWATWCAPCVAAIPHLNDLTAGARGRPIHIISVAYEPAAEVSAFLAEHPLRTLVALDNDLATFRAYGAWTLPTTVLVDGKGRIAGVVHPEDVTLEVLEQVLAGRVPDLEQVQPPTDPAGTEALFRRLLKAGDTIW